IKHVSEVVGHQHGEDSGIVVRIRMSIRATGELLNHALVDRLTADMASAVRRRPAHEVRLAGVLRALTQYSTALRGAVAAGMETLVRRGSYDRSLYMAGIRALGEIDDERAGTLLSKALLSSEEAGGMATLCAASFSRHPLAADPLAKVATSRHPHLAFLAEVARAARGECDGTHMTAIAPKIKESHRITMCERVFVPLSRFDRLPATVAPALAILRDAERHLGRWLVLAQIATRCSDPAPLAEARDRSKAGPSSARAAWSFVAWALSGETEPPTARPTAELIARLSDRPTADRDSAFLFRLAAVRAPTCRSMLENTAKSAPLEEEGAIRAACFLVKDYDRKDLRDALIVTAKTAKREDLRGLAMAALWDAGDKSTSFALAKPVSRSRSLPTAAWAGLIQAAHEHQWDHQLMDEPTFRRLQWGWLE
ncbi:MAG TPA: hypothetical protein PLJ27_20560, partial [Polyangiaceae bacterium]|nr:hypothetical protein [Polyangiaceae bacterium]